MSNAISTQAQRPKFSTMISTEGYQKLINNTLKAVSYTHLCFVLIRAPILLPHSGQTTNPENR